MKNNFKETKDELNCLNCMESEIIEFDIEEFLSLEENLNTESEYLVRGEGFNTEYRIVFDKEAKLFSICYYESHYTKFWNLKIKLSTYLKLKAKYFNEKGYNAQFDNQDGCHPVVDFVTNSKKENVKNIVQKIEKINTEFKKNIDELERQLENVIENYKFI